MRRGKEPLGQIRERLREANDQAYMESLWKQQLHAWGDSDRAVLTFPSSADDVPDIAELVVERLEAGKSRRILNSEFTHMSQLASSDPEPQIMKIGKWKGEVLKQAWLERAQGDEYGQGNFGDEHAMVEMEGGGLGSGFARMKFRTNPATGRQKFYLEQHPTILTLYDPEAKHPGRSEMCAFIDYIPYRKARHIFGKETADRYSQDYFTAKPAGGGSGRNPGVKAMKVIEYWSRGEEWWLPTRAVFPVNFSNAPLIYAGGGGSTYQENTLETLPWSYYVYFIAPGMRRPMGRIIMQTATQEMLQIMEDFMRYVLTNPSFDLIDLTQVEPRDWARYQQGKTRTVRFQGADVAKGFTRVPGQDLTPGFVQMRDWYERQYNSDSLTSEYDRGSMPEGDHTKFEVGMGQGRLDLLKSWGKRQMLRYYQQTIKTALQLMGRFDRDFMELDVFGYNVPINTDDPNSWLDMFTGERFKVLIDEDQIDARMAGMKRRERVADLQVVDQALNSKGLVNPVWFAEELLRATGTEDPQEAMDGAPALGMTEEAPGQGSSGAVPLEGMLAPAGLPIQP